MYVRTSIMVQLYSLYVSPTQGTVKQVLSFTGDDGHLLVMDISGHHLVAVSDTGVIKVWDINRR